MADRIIFISRGFGKTDAIRRALREAGYTPKPGGNVCVNCGFHSASRVIKSNGEAVLCCMACDKEWKGTQDK